MSGLLRAFFLVLLVMGGAYYYERTGLQSATEYPSEVTGFGSEGRARTIKLRSSGLAVGRAYDFSVKLPPTILHVPQTGDTVMVLRSDDWFDEYRIDDTLGIYWMTTCIGMLNLVLLGAALLRPSK